MPFSSNFSVALLLFTFLLTPLTVIAEDEATDNTPTETEAAASADTDDEDPADTEQSDESQSVVNEPTMMIERSSPQPAINRHSSVIKHLSLYQRQREVVNLVAADTPFHGLFLQETAGKPQGGVLILHDNQQHGHWPTVTGPLREYLPNYGWATLTVELPDQPDTALPARPVYGSQASAETDQSAEPPQDTEPAQTDDDTEATTPVSENRDSTGIAASGKTEPENEQPLADNEPALPRLTGLPGITNNQPDTTTTTQPPSQTAQQAYQQQMRLRLAAGIEYLNSRGQFNLVVIANGNSASWAVDYLNNQQQQRLANNEDLRGLALILIDPIQNTENQLYLEQQLQQLEIPVLDLITNLNNLNPADNKHRAGVMKHRQRNRYRQIYVAGPDLSSQQHQALKRRVRGWLKTNAAGTELPGS